MNRTKRYLLFLMLILALLAISTSVVFAKELGLLTISGPGIKGEVTLNDPKAMMGLEESGFFDQTAQIKPRTDLGEGYNLTVHLNLDGKMVPFVQMVYYPISENEPGYLHYTGRLEGQSLQAIDEWYVLPREADHALRNLMTANNITLQSALLKAPEAVASAAEAVPVTAPTVSSAPIQTFYIIGAVVAALLLLAGTGLVLRRRTASHPTM